MDNKFTKHGKYLASFMGHSINGTPVTESLENIDWKLIYDLSIFHNVLPLIFPVICDFDIPKEIKDKFSYNNHLYIAREARQEIESMAVFDALNQNNIRFIKLKGIVMKHYYPRPYMRTAADIDICLRKEDRLRARPIMLDRGYTLTADIDYNDAYEKGDFFIYELHSSIVSSIAPYFDLFSNPFEQCIPDSDNTNYVLNPEYFYTHMVVHLLNHFISGGCGLRHICDLYVFEKTHPDLNIDMVQELLKPYNLTEFLSTIRTLSVKLLEGKSLTDNEEEIANFLYKSGEYGDGTLKHISHLTDNKRTRWTFKDKCIYFLTLWFPGVKTMKKRYPVLEKAPFLLPVCWIIRIFYSLFFKRNTLKKQHKEMQNLNSKELKEAIHIRTIAGIK